MAAIPFLGNGVGGRMATARHYTTYRWPPHAITLLTDGHRTPLHYLPMTTARHYTTYRTLMFYSLGSTGTVSVEHDANGTAYFKTLMTIYLNQEFIFSILSAVQSI